MATDKKKEVKMKDLKPTKDAKGGVAHQQNRAGGPSMNRGSQQNAVKGGNANSTGGRSLL